MAKLPTTEKIRKNVLQQKEKLEELQSRTIFCPTK